MPASSTCPTCGGTLTQEASGERCLRCLLKLAFALDEPAPVTAGDPPHFEQPGDRVGRYRLLQQIGEGGYGVVYMAEQDEPVQRLVALKVIKLGMDTKQVIARFEAERQALAMMDHQNIARVFDAGATAAGRPYFVMELVRGRKITDYCDTRKFSTRQRLDLFIQVCQAIQHAHQKGIIHRDIKPSNVLVTEQDGAAVPKIIDFGVAKAMHDRLTDKTLFTAFEQFVGTPAYTSPEQAGLGGLDIDTRSDIYSLGVLLYELLTGRLPFETPEFQHAAVHEVLRLIRETEPPRPSARMTTLTELELSTVAQRRQIEPAKLPKLLRGDLDWIVMKTLDKDRRRRYETVNGLTTDLQRHLKNEPVAARPPGASYRFRKMVHRNQLAFAAVSAVLAALAIGLGVSSWEFLQEKQARERAVTAEHEEKELRERAEQARGEAEIARANEASLRKKAEARVKIVQGRTLYDAKKFDDAEKLLNQIDPADYEPDAIHSQLRRRLVWQYFAQEKWPEAVTNIAVLLQVNGADSATVMAQDRYLYANALVDLGDRAGYDSYRRGLLGLDPSNDNAELAKFLCEITMLMPADRQMLESVGRFYDTASTRLRYAETGSQDREVLRRISLALVDYRRGNYSAAIARCQTCLPQPISEPSRIPSVLAISALSHHQMGADAAARLELAFARQIVSPAFDQGTSNYVANSMGYWMELVETRSLLREATALIGAPPADAILAVTNAFARLGQLEASVKDTSFQNVTREQFDDLVKSAAEVPPLAIELEGARTGELFASLGRWQLARHDWPAAAARWDTVVYGPQNQGALLTGQDLSSFYLSYAPLLVVAGATNGYEKFRAQSVATFGGTGLPVNAERALTTCLLLPAGTNLIEALRIPAGVITSAKPPSAGWVPWGDSALALFEYRRGSPARSMALAQKNLSSTSLAPALVARFQVLNALAATALNQRDDAQSALKQCRETIETNFKAFSPDNSDGWHDWWIDHILLQEAVGLMAGGSPGLGQ